MSSKSVLRAGNLAGAAVLLIIASTVVFLCSCASAPPPPVEVEEPSSPPAYVHTVRYSGETLGLIARWYTGSTQNWTLIAEANPGLQPERINIGDTISIPPELMVTEDPFPQSSIRRSVASEGSNEGDSPVAFEGDAPASVEEVVGASAEDASVDELLGEIAAEREKQEVEAAAPVEDAADTLEELEAQLNETPEPAEVLPPAPDAPAAATPPADDAERERLLDELLAQ